MSTISVIVDGDEQKDENCLGILTPEKQSLQIKNIKVDKLKESLSELSEKISVIFEDIKQVGFFQLSEIQLQVEISSEGGFSLIGTAKAGLKGAITLNFQKTT